MSIKATIQHTIGVSDMIMDKYLADLTPEAFLERPIKGMNHIAWQVGHLILNERKMIEAIKAGSAPSLPEGFDVKHAMDQHGVDAPSNFQTKDEYLSIWKAQRAATRNLLEGMTEAELDVPCPNEKTRQMCPTVATMFNLTGLHALMHSGQFVAVRRNNEMPIAF